MFHEYREEIAELKQNNSHFHRLFEKHNELDHEIVRLEESHADQFEIESKKKDKLKVKDEIYNEIMKFRKEK